MHNTLSPFASKARSGNAGRTPSKRATPGGQVQLMSSVSVRFFLAAATLHHYLGAKPMTPEEAAHAQCLFNPKGDSECKGKTLSELLEEKPGFLLWLHVKCEIRSAYFAEAVQVFCTQEDVARRLTKFRNARRQARANASIAAARKRFDLR